MPLSAIQKGAIGQFAFLTTALVTGKGQIEVYTPAVDNEGRDVEVRRHLMEFPGLGIQVKIAFSIVNPRRRGVRPGSYIELRFYYPERMLRHLSGLWFFVAVFSVSELRLIDPAFLIPGDVVNKLARRGQTDRGIMFQIMANLDPNAHDRFSPYRVALKDLGARLLEIIDDAPLASHGKQLELPTGTLWVGRTRRGSAKRRLSRAA